MSDQKVAEGTTAKTTAEQSDALQDAEAAAEGVTAKEVVWRVVKEAAVETVALMAPEEAVAVQQVAESLAQKVAEEAAVKQAAGVVAHEVAEEAAVKQAAVATAERGAEEVVAKEATEKAGRGRLPSSWQRPLLRKLQRRDN